MQATGMATESHGYVITSLVSKQWISKHVNLRIKITPSLFDKIIPICRDNTIFRDQFLCIQKWRAWKGYCYGVEIVTQIMFPINFKVMSSF